MLGPALALAALCVLLAPRRAVADEDDGIEFHCTLEEQCLGGTECRDDGFDHAKFQGCEAAQREQGNELRCGRSPRSLWCAPGTHGTWKPHHSFLGISCSTSPGAPHEGGAALLGLAAVIALALGVRASSTR
jgi:hypothetical protein